MMTSGTQEGPLHGGLALSPSAAAARPGLVQTLLDHRIPQVAGVYLAGAWTFVEFVQWLTDRYVLSPYLSDACLVLLVLMLPTALLVTWPRRGGPSWSPLHRVGIPCNVLGAGAVLFALFGGKDMGSAQTTVTVTDAGGNQVERVVPKSAFRKRVALFGFANATGDAAHRWVEQGIPYALSTDLAQDLFLTTTVPGAFRERLQKAGFEDGRDVPLALQREIARDFRLDYLLNGKVQQAGSTYRVVTSLYQTDNGKLLEERTFEGPDFFRLVDEVSVQLKHDLEVPSRHVEETPDLPVSELLTTSLPVYQRFVAGAEHADRKEFAQAAALLAEAVQADPTFAMASLVQAQVTSMMQQLDVSVAAFRAAQQHSYRLPERYRYVVSANLFILSQQPGEALRAAEQWHALYPDDVLALSVLAQLHQLRGQVDPAVDALRKLIALDPAEQQQLLTIGDLLLQHNRPEEALREFEAYTRQAPDDVEGYRRVGRAYTHLGDLDRAAEAYRQALVAEPGHLDTELDLANIDFRKGAYDEALTRYEQALARAQTPRERNLIHDNLATRYHLLGRYDAFYRALQEAWEEQTRLMPPALQLLERCASAPELIEAGYADDARRFCEQARALPEAGNPLYAVKLDAQWARLLTATGGAADAIALVQRFVETFHSYGLSLNLGEHVLYGEAYQALGQWAQAAAAYEQALAKARTDVHTHTRLGEVYLAAGETAKAEAAFREALRYFPAYPDAHLGLAKALRDLGRAVEAREHLAQALAAWAGAAPGCAAAAEARTLQTAL